jgi:hypothetical protein
MSQAPIPAAPIAPVLCPHCQAPNAAGASFCEACGKAMPAMSSSGPRVVDETGMASTGVGQRLQLDELQKQAKKAAGALLAVAIIQTIVCGILIAIAQSNNRLNTFALTPIFLGLGAMAVLFWCLYFWARVQPLPAAIVGLVLYATMITINVIMTINAMSADSGPGRRGGTGIGGIGIGWIDILIMIVLGKAISAGAKYRRMSARLAEGAPAAF